MCPRKELGVSPARMVAVTFDCAGDALWRISNKAWTLLQLMERYVNAAIVQRADLMRTISYSRNS